MSDRLFRIEKIAAFGGGVKSNSQNPKRGGGGVPRGRQSSSKVLPSAVFATHDLPKLASLISTADEHKPLDTALLVTLRASELGNCSRKAHLFDSFHDSL
jgi:hypothetical protein